MDILKSNKEIIIRFNKEVIEKGNVDVFNELMDNEFINHSAPDSSNGKEGMIYTFNNILRPAFPDLKVEIIDQIAEGDKVTTRKTISATHLGELMGITATHKKVTIDVIDIVRLRNGKYFEHWGMNNLPTIIAQLKS